FLCASSSGPLRTEAGQRAPNLVAVDAVAALIRTPTGSIFDARGRDSSGDDVCQFADSIVLFCLPYIEDFVMDEGDGCIEHAPNRSHDVTNVHDRTPGRAVTLNRYPSRSERRSYKIVQHHVQPQPRRSSISGRIPQKRRTEMSVSQLRYIVLDEDLRLAIRRHWIERSLLVQESISGRTVRAAGGREDETPYPCCFGQLGKLY